MAETEPGTALSRRELLRRIGQSAGAAMLYQSMTTLGFAGESNYSGPINLSGAPRGASVLVLGAGMAGLVAALELHRAGYKVTVLEYNDRAGGRAWTLRGGDEYTELGGFRQRCEFDPGHYLNPGPWRIPYHHHAMLDYAKRFKVPLEPFTQVNFNAYVHARGAFGGKPQRFRSLHTDFHGHVAELLGKAVNGGHLDADVNAEDKEKLLEALRTFGFLDKDLRYRKSDVASSGRGFDRAPGGGLAPPPLNSEPLALGELVQSNVWRALRASSVYDLAPSLFEPVGGMDRIPAAIHREIAPLVQFGAKVVRIDQNERGVEVSYVDAHHQGPPRTVRADWCVCTIPLSILSQIEVKISEPMAAAIQAVPYEASVKIGLQFKRRFWEDDDRIYGGISYTDLPIGMIGYPMSGQNAPGKGVLLGAYSWGANAYELTAQAPEERVRLAVQFGAQIHPQYPAEFENGISVAWHRVPFANGCFAKWSDAAREKHYENLCQIDGRIVLAGEHASRLPAWQEGAVLSALDAIGRLHQRAIATHARPRKMYIRTHRGVGVPIASLLLLATCALATMCCSADEPAVFSPPSQGGALAPRGHFVQSDGAALYRAICQGCHMPDARGAHGAGMYPALAANPKLASAAFPVLTVLQGRRGMPGFADSLSDDQVAEVVNYVRSHFDNRYADTISAEDVARLRSSLTSAGKSP